MQGHRTGSLGGAGLSAAFGVGAADVGSVNPAALGAFEQAALGLAYQLETSIEDGYIGRIGYVPMNGVRPQSAAAVLPLGAWVLGASYSQRYAAEMDFPPIPVQTPENPEIDPDLNYPDVTWSSRVETFSPQVAYRPALRDGGELALGVRVGFGYARFEGGATDGSDGSLSDWGTQVAAGVSYRRPGAYGLAAHFESALRVEGYIDRDVRFQPNGPTTTIAVPYADAIPARLGLSAEVAVTPTVRLGADAARVFWKAAWDGDDQFKDQTEAAVWTRLDVAERALVSFGLFAQGRNRWDNGLDEIFDYSGRAVYVTAGGVVTFDRFRLDAVVADSHLLAADQHKQTLVKVGASVQF